MTVELAIKSVLLLALVLVFAALLRGASAAVRHRVFALGFLGLAALPLLVGRVPAVEIVRPATAPPAPSRIAPAPPASLGLAVPTPPTAQASPLPEPHPFPAAEVATFVWLLGALAVAGRLAFLLLEAAGLARRGVDLPAVPAFGVPPHTRVLRNGAIDVPMTCGFLRPTILLPSASAGWSDDRLRAALLHEGAHVRRGDWAWLILTGLLCAAYWFNPLAWWAASRMRAESELAADDAVLRAGMPAPQYAEALVEFATDLRNGRRLAALPIVERATLKARVAEILRAAKPRGPLSRRAAAAALGLGAAAVAAFAAARLVTGPVVVRDGVLEFEPGKRLEIVAITEMQGERARSWDVRGALLPEPFPIDAEGRRLFDAVGEKPPLGAVVRYVVFRGNFGDEPWPSFARRRGGETMSTWGCDGRSIGGSRYIARDASGGSDQVVRLVLPAGSKTADLHTRAWNSGWTVAGYATFDGGRETGLLNPLLDISIARNPGGDYAKTKVDYVLPPDFADRQTEVRITPNPKTFLSLDGAAGPQRAYSDVAFEKVQKVEIRSRPSWPVVFADLPMGPDPAARYRPRRFEPEGLIRAKAGRANLPDGSTLAFQGVAGISDHRDAFWKADGSPSGLPSIRATGYPGVGRYGMRFVQLRLLTSPGAKAYPQDYYDGEGRGLLSNSSATIYRPEGTVFALSALLPVSRRELDLTLRIAVGKYATVAQGSLNRTKGYRSQILKNGRLSVEYPPELEASIQGMDARMEPLDAQGKPVTNVGGGSGSSRSGNRIEFDLKPDRAKLVKGFAIRARPYAWVEFPGVRLYPKGE